MAAIVGQLGRTKPTQRVWIQILAKGHGKKGILTGQLKAKSTWTKYIDEAISELLVRDQKNRVPVEKRYCSLGYPRANKT